MHAVCSDRVVFLCFFVDKEKILKLHTSLLCVENMSVHAVFLAFVGLPEVKDSTKVETSRNKVSQRGFCRPKIQVAPTEARG